jgi:hypothetical protein
MLKMDHFIDRQLRIRSAVARTLRLSPKTGQEWRDWYGRFEICRALLRIGRHFGREGEGIGQGCRGPDEPVNSTRLSDGPGNRRHAILARRLDLGPSNANLRRRRPTAGQLRRLTELEELLRPKELVNKVRGIVINADSGSLDFDELDDVQNHDYAAAAARSAAVVEGLGRDVSIDEETFTTLLPELAAEVGAKVGDFGRGVALGSDSPRAIWNTMVAQLARSATPSVAFLCGFLTGVHERDRVLADALLDEALVDTTLAKWFPLLQRSVVIDAKALERLHRALELGTAPVVQFMNLAWGRACEGVSGPDFKRLVLAIGSKPEGLVVALGIVSMRFHSDRSAADNPFRTQLKLASGC